MKLPVWLFMCSPLRLLIYAAALFVFDFVLLLGINSLIKEVKDKVSQTANNLSRIYLFNILTQAIGFATMAISTDLQSPAVAEQLKSAEYYTFEAYSIPLLAYLVAVLLMYFACRFFFLRATTTDVLTCKVAAWIIALFTSPWIILLPIAV